MVKKTFLLSDESVNSHKFRVKTEGIDLSIFLKNPVMLLDHKPENLIGKWENVRVEGVNLFADAVFDEEDDFAKKQMGKVERGFLNGVSLGLEPIEFVEVFEGVPELSKSILREVSLTSVGSNGNALRLCNSEGKVLDDKNMYKLFLNQNQPTKMKELLLTLASILGLKAEDSTQEKVTASVQNLVNDKKAADVQLIALKAKVEETEKKTAESLIQLALDQKKITVDQKDTYLKLAAQDFESTKKILDSIQPAVNLATLTAQQQQKGNPAGERASWTIRDYEKKDPSGLLQLKKNNPDQYKTLYEATYGAAKAGVTAVLILMLSFAQLFMPVDASAQGIAKAGKKVEFTFPNGITENKQFLFPTFDFKSVPYSDTITVTINQLHTYVSLNTLTGNAFMTLNIQSHVLSGAMLYIEAPSDTSIRTLSFDANKIKSASIVGVANKRKTQGFIYNGTYFVPMGASVQIN